MKIFLLLLLVCFTETVVTEAVSQGNLAEKFFLFPKRSIDSYVLLKPHESREMARLTLCLRFYSELKQKQTLSLFSAASQDHHNEILIFKEATHYDISLGNQVVIFQIPEEKGRGLGEDLCLTWDSATGIMQLWLNRIPLPRKVIAKGYRIKQDLVIMLGQDQDSYGGSLDARQAFEGELGEVYLWDSILSAAQLRSDQRQGESTPLLDWSSLNYEIKGDVVVVPSSL